MVISALASGLAPVQAAPVPAGERLCKELTADPDNAFAAQPSDFRKWERGYRDGRNAVAELHGHAVPIEPRGFPEIGQWQMVWQHCVDHPDAPFAQAVAAMFKEVADAAQ